MNRLIKGETALRTLVEKLLECALPDWAWEIAKIERAVSEVLEKENDAEWLAGKLRSWVDTGGPSESRATPDVLPPRRHRRGKTVQSYGEAVSEAIAEIVRGRRDVRAFRHEVLSDQLLKPEEVEPWIKDHQKDEVYPHAVLLRVKKLDYRTGWPIDPPLQLAQNDQIEGVANVDCLEYGKPGSGWVHRVPIGRDGTLRVLHELSKTLATFFHWQAAQATAFVLTDLTPVIETESVAVHPAPHVTVPYGGPQPLACLVRVTLTIDPIMTPKELARKYASVRNRLLVQKPRALSTKHLALAVFTTKHPALNQESMEQWAREFPQWKYRRISQFGRDARTARSRLLHRSPVDVLGTFSRAKSKPSSD